VCVGMLCRDGVRATCYCFYASLHKSHFWTMSNLYIKILGEDVFNVRGTRKFLSMGK
jgi:hypothetical protein